MSSINNSRRDFLKAAGAGALSIAVNLPAFGQNKNEKTSLTVNPKPIFDLSPYLYMQFMEPLGTTDGSVAAAWDFQHDCWRKDVIEVTKKLSPSMIRWGGCFSSYYRFKEAIGPRDKRKPMLNLLWGGIETNQVGTAEFVDFCRKVGAEPLICVNFESDGRKHWMISPKGEVRTAGPEEAAEWVDYCNNPSNKLRIKHGAKRPYNVPFWGIGNETSYNKKGYDCQTAAERTVIFAKEMRKADPSIKLIGWGDSGWAPKMLDIAGEHLQYIAFHHMFDPGKGVKHSPLRGIEYRKDPAKTWEYLVVNTCKAHEKKINRMRQDTSGYKVPLALTECHLALPGRNRCEVLSTWAAGVACARMMNLHERNGDVLKIATLADFCGTRWQVNAIMIPVPKRRKKAYMMPVAKIMWLYRKHTGQRAIKVTKVPEYLDVTASRTTDTIYLHVVNTNRTKSVTTQLAVEGKTIKKAKVFEMATDPEFEVFEMTSGLLVPEEKAIVDNSFTFPPASVCAVEIRV